jgi:adenylate cyclase class 2
MPIEVEKKYRLTDAQRDLIVRRLAEIGAKHEGQVFEENLLFDGAALKGRNCVLRLRRVAGKAILTFKERLPGTSATKRQREEETPVQDGDTMQTILADLGYRPKVVYEKKRETWRLGAAEIVIDELPFGLFMEIEGSETEIENTENALAIADLIAETATYPQLAAISGTLQGSIIEARFTRRNGGIRSAAQSSRFGSSL